MSIQVKDLHFTLVGKASSYSFYVGDNGDLISSHFGGPVQGGPFSEPAIVDGNVHQVDTYGRVRREFPDNGNGDHGLPAIRIRHGEGTTVTRFRYDSYEVVEGKRGVEGLPATFGDESAASTLLITLKDDIAELDAVLSYAVFPTHNAFARSFSLVNRSPKEVVIEAAASFSIDMSPAAEGRDMLQLSGEWARETQMVQRPIHQGFQGCVRSNARCTSALTSLASTR